MIEMLLAWLLVALVALGEVALEVRRPLTVPLCVYAHTLMCVLF